MNINEIAILLLTGLISGVLSGALGIGGGIIVVPALVFFLGLTQHSAQGTSLFFMLFPVGLLGVMNYYKQGFVNIKFGLILAIAFFIGSYFGSVISLKIDDAILKRIFGVLFFFVGLKMILGK